MVCEAVYFPAPFRRRGAKRFDSRPVRRRRRTPRQCPASEARPTDRIWISKEFPSISKFIFGALTGINRLRAAGIWILQAFPNFYLAETRDINGLRSKKFGNSRFFSKNLRSVRPPNAVLSRFCLTPVSRIVREVASGRPEKGEAFGNYAAEKLECLGNVSLKHKNHRNRPLFAGAPCRRAVAGT